LGDTSFSSFFIWVAEIKYPLSDQEITDLAPTQSAVSQPYTKHAICIV
jgi:hypothetical protein